jgi:hypothetical protein
MGNAARRTWGLQFHPEVVHTHHGSRILENFLVQVCGCSRDWTMTAFIQTARTKYDAFGNPLMVLDPLASAPGGIVDFTKGHARELEFDSQFHAYPIRETIHIGNGGEPLVFQAEYNPAFGTVAASIDFWRYPPLAPSPTHRA